MCRCSWTVAALAVALLSFLTAFFALPAADENVVVVVDETRFFRAPASHAWDDVDLTGRTALVTGGTSGIGRAVARRLVALGATVVITSRNAARAEKAAAEMSSGARAGGRAVGASLDLTNLTDVRRFADDLVERLLPDGGGAPNLLVENAGMVHLPVPGEAGLNPWITEDGFEHMYAGNYLGHFLLMRLLTTPSRRTPDRVVLNSSNAHWKHESKRRLSRLLPSGTDSVARKSLERASLSESFTQYGNTKFLQIVSAFEAQRRFPGVVSATPVAPGFVRTDIGNNAAREMKDQGTPGVNLLAQNPDQGAETILHALLSPEPVAPGTFLQPYWSPLNERNTVLGGLDFVLWEPLLQKVTWGMHHWKAHPDAYDEEFAKQLWEDSTRAVEPWLK